MRRSARRKLGMGFPKGVDKAGINRLPLQVHDPRVGWNRDIGPRRHNHPVFDYQHPTLYLLLWGDHQFGVNQRVTQGRVFTQPFNRSGLQRLSERQAGMPEP